MSIVPFKFCCKVSFCFKTLLTSDAEIYEDGTRFKPSAESDFVNPLAGLVIGGGTDQGDEGDCC
jgi:hypothetical protein